MGRKHASLVYRIPLWQLAGALFDELELTEIKLVQLKNGKWQARVTGAGGRVEYGQGYSLGIAVRRAVLNYARAEGYEVEP